MYSRFTGYVLILVLVMFWPCGTQAQEIDSAIRAADVRLNKPVTFTARHIALGDLISALSHQTTVSVAMSPQSDAFYIQVAVSLQNVPLGEALDAVWSLFSYQQAAWVWQRSGNAGSYRYEFVRPPAAQHYAEQMLSAPADRMQQEWVLPGDDLAPAIAKRGTLPGKADDPRLHDWPTDPSEGKRKSVINGVPVCPLRERLSLLTEASGVSVLALRPEDNSGGGPTAGPELTDFYRAPFDMTIERFVQLLERYSPYRLHKYRHRILLLSYPEWTGAQDLPGKFVAQLRQEAIVNGGFLPVSAISRAIATLPQGQLNRLTVDFPILGSVFSAAPIYALYTDHPEIVTDTGLQVTPEIVSLIKGAVCLDLNSPLLKGKAIAMRLRERDNPYNDQGGRYIDVEYLDNVGRWCGVVGFWSAPGYGYASSVVHREKSPLR